MWHRHDTSQRSEQSDLVIRGYLLLLLLQKSEARDVAMEDCVIYYKWL